ncbi:hypothetical protein AYI70_g1470 [Smittium culicis]|uniref:Uncharacterized protein n=1 Tax=Smittium culicis TaxID=133412 RepID=A0A1R1YD54_9FUNG|nr:hypothetical protein AYI70_g1470 [Smittium culicis]
MSDMTKLSLKFSHPEPAKVEFSTPSASLIKNNAPKTYFNNAIIHETPKISGDDKHLPKNESSGTKSTTINRLRASDKNQKVSPADDTKSDESRDEVKLPKTKGTNKKFFESDDSQDSSSIKGSSSPIEIKKE